MAHSNFDENKVITAVKTLHEDGDVYELRVLDVKLNGPKGWKTHKALSGFFNSPESLAKELKRIKEAKGIYVTLNPVQNALLNRSMNKLNDQATRGFATKDTDIRTRRWLLIDCDPIRPAGVSANEEELAKAKGKAEQIKAFLTDRGWSEPVFALSGNGFHLLYRIDLPADDQGLLKRVLNALSEQLGGDGVDIDKSVFNASRITKLYGTLACKGDPSEDRPHRMSEMLSVPETFGIVTKEQLEQVASLGKEEGNAKTQSSQETARETARNLSHGFSSGQTRAVTTKGHGAAEWNAYAFVDDFVAKHGISVARTENKAGGTYYLLDECPWAAEHGGATQTGDATIIVRGDGSLGFKCFHSHCSNRHWRDLRLLYEPDFEEKRLKARKVRTDRTDRLAFTATDADPETEAESRKLRATFFDIMKSEGLTAAERKSEIAKETVAALHERGRFFFHTDRKDFKSTMFFDAKRKVLLQVSSDDFNAWLSGFTGINMSDKTFDYVSSACRQEALAGDTTGIVPSVFWHSTPTAVYLSNGDGCMVKISGGRIEEMDNGSDDVLFVSGQTLQPWKLVTPADPFESCKVFSDADMSQESLELLRLWAVSLPTGLQCKPPLVLTGTVGSGKTKIACSIFELYGIPKRIALLNDTKQDDFWTQIDCGGLVCFDNADSRIKWLPDALQVAATNGSQEKRMLYSNGDVYRQYAKSWIVLTSANPTFASDAGLADRLLVARLERRKSETAESSLSVEIEQNRNGGLSWIAETLSKAFADDRPVEGCLNRRHPDFAKLAVRIGRAMGREAQAVAALQAAENDKSRFNLENDEIGSLLLELGEWQGTASDLLKAITGIDFNLAGRWTAQRLGKRLNKLWVHLESTLQATKTTDSHTKQMTYRFSQDCGGCGGLNAVSVKPPINLLQGDFPENALPSPASSANSFHPPIFSSGMDDLVLDDDFLSDKDDANANNTTW